MDPVISGALAGLGDLVNGGLPLADIDQVKLNFSDSSLYLLNAVLAFLMFGIALDTKTEDFRRVAKMPKAMAVGIGAQFVLLPAITWVISVVLGFSASISLGMILVACCPPGAISNVLTYRAKGDVALSVSMTAIANLMAIFLMAVNISFWGGIHPEASKILKEIDVSTLKLLVDLLLILGIPFAIGMIVAHRYPNFQRKALPWVRRLSLAALVAFILIAFVSNVDAFWKHIPIVALAVFIHDTLALSLGYGIGAVFRLEERSRRAITYEVGVRNTGLGLGIVFSFFGGLGGMAMVAGWWGIWDIMAGLLLAAWFARRPAGGPDDGEVTMAGDGEVS